MNYYYSGIAGSSPWSIKPFKEMGLKTILASYHMDSKSVYKHFIDDGYLDDSENARLMIDSGAFTIWNSNGSPIDVRDYAKYCQDMVNHKFQPKELTFINLDVIPNRNSSSSEIQQCVDEGKENFLYLAKTVGVEHILPVIHLGENMDLIDFYLNEGSTYIAIGGLVGAHGSAKDRFILDVFRHLPDNFKVHGLGYSTKEGLYQYPFYSVDSVSYKRAPRKCLFAEMRFWCCAQGQQYVHNKNYIDFEAQFKQITDYWESKGIVYNG